MLDGYRSDKLLESTAIEQSRGCHLSPLRVSKHILPTIITLRSDTSLTERYPKTFPGNSWIQIISKRPSRESIVGEHILPSPGDSSSGYTGSLAQFKSCSPRTPARNPASPAHSVTMRKKSSRASVCLKAWMNCCLLRYATHSDLDGNRR